MIELFASKALVSAIAQVRHGGPVNANAERYQPRGGERSEGSFARQFDRPPVRHDARRARLAAETYNTLLLAAEDSDDTATDMSPRSRAADAIRSYEKQSGLIADSLAADRAENRLGVA